MAVAIKSGGAKLEKPPEPAAIRTVRKIALCGSHDPSLRDAPWTDPSWEFWGHASSHAWYARPMDRYFEMHIESRWRRVSKKGDPYLQWITRLTKPIYMQKHFPDVPASIRYPKGQVLMEFSYAHRRHYFTNTMAWMTALAIIEGATHIGLFGISYQNETEYARQRGCAEYWIGQLDGRGIAVHLPEQCTLLREPAGLYGYESHDEETGLLKDEYKRKEFRRIEPVEPNKSADGIIQPPEHLKKLIEREDATHPRPEWAQRPHKGNGGIAKEASSE